MQLIFVLEPTDQIYRDLHTALKNVDSELKIMRFPDTTAISDFIGQLLSQDFSDEELETHFAGEFPSSIDIPLIVLNALSIGKMQTSTMEKLQGLLIQSGFCEQDQPTGFVLLGTAPIPVDFRTYIHPCVRNFLTTPFDPLNLQEFFRVAIEGNKKINTELFTEQNNFHMEMLKSVNITRITELGFRTSSSRKIERGRKAKYFSHHFGEGKNQSVYAYCYANNKISDSEYTCSFGFFGISQIHLLKIRKSIAQAKNSEMLEFYDEPPKQSVNMSYLTFNDENFERMAEVVTEKLQNITPTRYEKFEDINLDNKSYCILTVDETAITSDEQRQQLFDWRREKKIRRLYLCSKWPIDNYSQLEKNMGFDDVMYLPLDDFYFSRMIKQNAPSLREKQPGLLTRKSIVLDETIDSGIQLEIEEVSEIHIGFNYYRPIRIADVRRFRFESLDREKSISIMAICNFVDEKPSGEAYCEFVFYGISSDELEFLRQWLIQGTASQQV